MSEGKDGRGRPNVIGIDKGLGPLEAKVLRAVGELDPPVSTREVCDHLGRQGYFAYQGVLNCMNRLVRKGILERTRRGVAFVYRPLVDLDELSAQLVSNVLGHMGGRLERVICRLLQIDPEVGAQQIAELRRRVQTASRQTKR